MAGDTWRGLRPASRTPLGGLSSSLGTEGQPPFEQRPDSWTQGPGGASLPTQPGVLPGQGGRSRSSPYPWARPLLLDGTSQRGRGSAVTPSGSGPTQGSGKGTASGGDLLGKGRGRVGSFACRGHRHRQRI